MKFTKLILNENLKAFVPYITSLSLEIKIIIHLAQKAEIISFGAKCILKSL